MGVMVVHQEQLFQPPPPEPAPADRGMVGPRRRVDLDFTRLDRTHQELRALARALSTEFEVGEDEALQAVLFWRTEDACRRYMEQRWYRHEIEYRRSGPDSM